MDCLPRPGIVRTKICGMFVLVPTRIASAECKTILPLSIRDLVIWNGIEKDYSFERVFELCRAFSKLPDEELNARITEFCEKLREKGFTIPKDEA